MNLTINHRKYYQLTFCFNKATKQMELQFKWNFKINGVFTSFKLGNNDLEVGHWKKKSNVDDLNSHKFWINLKGLLVWSLP